jgi:hypothetical protein
MGEISQLGAWKLMESGWRVLLESFFGPSLGTDGQCDLHTRLISKTSTASSFFPRSSAAFARSGVHIRPYKPQPILTTPIVARIWIGL